MRPWIPLVLSFAAIVAAQGGSSNVINNPSSGIQATAGEPLTISWANPSSGTITIKIQTSGDIRPTDGVVVAENIPNTGAATFNVPPGVPAGEVFVQIIDDSNPSDYNFSGGFEVQGATNTATAVESTASAASAASAVSTPLSTSDSNSASSASDSTAPVRPSDSASMSESDSESTSVSMSMSSMSASASASASSASASSESDASSSSSAGGSSRSSASSASRTSSSGANAQSTSAPSDAAVPVRVQTGLMAAVLGAAALVY